MISPLILVHSLLLLLLHKHIATAFPIRVVAVTDAHGWYAGHRHNESFDADYGTLCSFVDNLRASSDTPVFTFENGDLVDGSGLTDAHSPLYARGRDVFSILSEFLNFSARTLGNHELYSYAAIESLARHSRPDEFVTSNIISTASSQPLFTLFKRLPLNGTSSLLVLGFLYEMEDAVDQVRVLKISNVVASPWLVSQVSDPSIAGLVLLTHMGATDRLISTLLRGIRALRGPHLPVLFIAGHTHLRMRISLDSCALALEAGRYSDTVGLIEWDGCRFDSRYVDFTTRSLFEVAGPARDSSRGLAVREQIAQARKRLGLDRKLGFSSQTFLLDRPASDSASIWHFFLNLVAPSQILPLSRPCPGLFFTNTGVLRYSLLRGDVLVDDLYAVCPFQDDLRTQVCVSSQIIAKALDTLDLFMSSRTGRMERFLWTSFDPAIPFYNVIADVYDAPRIFSMLGRPGSSRPYGASQGLNVHTSFVRYFVAAQTVVAVT